MISNNIHIEEDLRDLYFQIEREYHKLAGDRGTIIEEITNLTLSIILLSKSMYNATISSDFSNVVNVVMIEMIEIKL